MGRSTFELAKGFALADGLDYSTRFIETANEIRAQGQIAYDLKEEGDLASRRTRSLADLGLDFTATRVAFHQGNAQDLPDALDRYDLVFAGNLIDRLPDPRSFLTAIHERMNPGGLLVLTSPYTWLSDFTPKENWLGGYTRDGTPVSTIDGLKETLAHRFDCLESEREVPFVIRETRRKFQHTVASLTAWRLR